MTTKPLTGGIGFFKQKLRVGTREPKQTAMSYMVTVSFDLKNAKAEDYDRVYNAFKSLGLYKQIKADNGAIVQLPTTTCAGFFNGTSAETVRDDLANRTHSAVEQLGLSGEIFVAIGGNWSWAHRLPKVAAPMRW